MMSFSYRAGPLPGWAISRICRILCKPAPKGASNLRFFSSQDMPHLTLSTLFGPLTATAAATCRSPATGWTDAIEPIAALKSVMANLQAGGAPCSTSRAQLEPTVLTAAKVCDGAITITALAALIEQLTGLLHTAEGSDSAGLLGPLQDASQKLSRTLRVTRLQLTILRNRAMDMDVKVPGSRRGTGSAIVSAVLAVATLVAAVALTVLGLIPLLGGAGILILGIGWLLHATEMLRRDKGKLPHPGLMKSIAAVQVAMTKVGRAGERMAAKAMRTSAVHHHKQARHGNIDPAKSARVAELLATTHGSIAQIRAMMPLASSQAQRHCLCELEKLASSAMVALGHAADR